MYLKLFLELHVTLWGFEDVLGQEVISLSFLSSFHSWSCKSDCVYYLSTTGLLGSVGPESPIMILENLTLLLILSSTGENVLDGMNRFINRTICFIVKKIFIKSLYLYLINSCNEFWSTCTLCFIPIHDLCLFAQIIRHTVPWNLLNPFSDKIMHQ